MKNNNSLHSKIDDTLNSLEEVKRAMPAPFLLTRVLARLNKVKETYWEKAVRFISRPSVAIIGLSVLIALNVLVIVLNHHSVNNSTEEQAGFVTNGDFSTANTTINNILNAEP